MLCSFQRPEPWQPTVQWPMPDNIAPPEQCPYVYEHAEAQVATPGINQRVKDYLIEYIAVSMIPYICMYITHSAIGTQEELLDR